MLGLSLGKVTCLFCGARVRRREARKAQAVKGAYVCGSCYAKWDKGGRQCVACGTAVRGVQDVGLFADRKALGPADCGGLRVLRA